MKPNLRFSEFSREWVEKRLGEVARIYQPKTISEKDFSKQGYPVYGANGKIGYYYKYNHEKWQVIITCRGSTCGTINKTEDKVWITGNSMVVNVDNNPNLNKTFLFYLLQVSNFNKIIEGSGQPQITQNSLKNFKIHIPEPKEQEKIAEFLSSIDDKIELNEKKLSKLKEYKKGLLQKLLNVKDGVPELRFPEFSGEWIEKRLGKVARIYQPKTISEKDFSKQGYPVYGANGKIGYYYKYNHEKWQVIITCRGSTCGTINKTEDKVWITGNSMVVNVDNNPNLNKTFLFYLLQVSNFNKIIEGSGQPQITQNSLKNFKIHIPEPKEQQKIAEFLSSIDDKIELNEKKLSKLKEYKKGLLQKMFV